MEIRGMKIIKQIPMMKISLAMLLLGEKAGKCLVSVSVFSDLSHCIDKENSRSWWNAPVLSISPNPSFRRRPESRNAFKNFFLDSCFRRNDDTTTLILETQFEEQ
jgi:hypothetical protein